MWLWLTGAGIASIGYGLWLKIKRMDEWDSEESMEMYRGQIDHHRQEFLNQFKLSQESLNALYAEDFEEFRMQLSQISHQMNEIQTFLRDSESERKLEGVSMSPEKKEKVKKIWELKQRGYSDEEIARQLGMGLGEVLLLKQMHK